MNDIVWRPTPEIIEQSNLKHFMTQLGQPDYAALLEFGNRSPDAFWDAAIRYLDIRFDTPYQAVRDISEGLPWTRWCVGGTTNLAANLLDKHRGTPVMEKTALIGESETGEVRQYSYAELDALTCRLANGLRARGLTAGDAVGLYMPYIPETAIAFLALARIGAMVVPLFSGFAAEAVATRLNDAGAVAVISVDGMRRRGQAIDSFAILNDATRQVPSLKTRIIVPWLNNRLSLDPATDHLWDDVLAGQPDNCENAWLDSEQPLLVVYTSGTTGKPKGTIVGHHGLSVKCGLDFHISMDLKATDRLIWMTDFGWVVGAMTLAGALFAGGSIIMVEGAPDYPDAGRLWRVSAEHAATFIGVAPTAVRSLMRYGVDEVKKYDLHRLRVAASTGEPWTEEAWTWFFTHVLNKQAPLLNWSGGTEIGGGILSGTVIHPLKPCSFAGPMPGMGADIFDDDGRPVGPNQVGELVLTQPSIGLTRGLWKDPERYLETYWQMYENIWRHGDWASRDADGMWYVHGRSDDTLKVGGKRTGPAEIEGLIMATGKVTEAAAIGIPDKIAGEAVMCVSVPAPGVTVDDLLRAAISDAVAKGLGHPFRPKRQLFVPDLPKTRSLKIMRRVVRALVLGDAPGDLSSLTNPEAIDSLKAAVRDDTA